MLGAAASPLVLAPASLLFVGVGLFWLHRRGLISLGRGGKNRRDEAATAIVGFYERMTAALAARGINRRADETPLEFAEGLGTPEVLAITRAYNRVRFGACDLTGAEADEVERHLRKMEGQES